ncbi:MAG: 3-hydroxyacyl-CoA dehydrogenase NAD-binding domain-containing protein [Chloroflexi bacterium]|nr:3-hydroxyacyl-CoA dehydrogenase NAD-binding domain-containing protein [Chloroflexota bacterium]
MKRADEISSVACVGGGTIGFSWAALFARHGLRVNIYDVSDALLRRAGSELRSAYDTLVNAGLMTVEEASAALDKISLTADLTEALRDVDFVQESGPERYAIKREIYRELDRLAPPDIVLASSTSAMLMTEIQSATARPERCVVAHPYNPPHIVPSVEIVPGEATSLETVEIARDFMARMGRVPVVACKECRGHIVNHMQAVLFREAIWLVGNGVATVEEIDLAFRTGPGLRWALMGPFMVGSLTSPGGLRDILIDGKLNHRQEDDIPSRVEREAPPRTAENEREWARECVAQMEAALADADMEQVKKWRDRKLLQIMDVLASD